MAGTIRELIIADIATNLRNILTTNGYETNLGQYVVRSSDIGEDSNLPGIALAAMADSASRNYKRDVIEMTVNIMAASKHTFGASQQADKLIISQLMEQMLGDIRRAMGQTLQRTDDVIYQSGGPSEYPVERNNEIFVKVECEYIIKYQTDKNSPFLQ